VDPDPHPDLDPGNRDLHPDPHPHQIKNPDPHQSDKLDTEPDTDSHQFTSDKPECMRLF
jgi:hypothetical protein